jgi:uncharacterized protein YodC (DUF2158 family)
MEDKIFFQPGDIVTLRQDIPNKPTMLVIKKETGIIRPKDGQSSDFLKGIRCRWFTEFGGMEEAVFNTKDLILID